MPTSDLPSEWWHLDHDLAGVCSYSPVEWNGHIVTINSKVCSKFVLGMFVTTSVHNYIGLVGVNSVPLGISLPFI